MRLSAFFIFTAIFFASTVAGRNVPFSTEQKITGLYPPVSGVLSGKPVPESPDPLVAYRWTNPRASDGLESYLLTPVSVGIDRPENVKRIGKKTAAIRVDGPCDLMFDFGRVSAGWLEFDSDDLDGEVEMSISEYTEPAVLNAGAQHPHKTAVPVRYGNTYRLELNTELYEGVRYGWIHVRSLRRPATISAVRLVCQTKPANYEGSFRCSDPTLTRIWYTGAYTVKLNLLKEYFGAILMERSDRHSWTGDAHPSQAASMVAFGNYDFVKQNLYYTSTQFNGIAPSGAFVPLEEERIKISGTVEKTWEVEPLLRVEWVGEPVVNADGTVDVKVKVSRGTDNPDYQEALAEAWLFVSENMYVGDFSYSPNYSTRISGAAIGMVQFDQVYTIRTGQPGGYNPAGTYTPFPAFSRKYFLRFGARTTRQFDGTNRYNYTTVKEITTIAR